MQWGQSLGSSHLPWGEARGARAPRVLTAPHWTAALLLLKGEKWIVTSAAALAGSLRGGVSLFEQRVLFRVCEGTGQMSSVCVAQEDRVSGELAKSILLLPDCRTHRSDGTVSNTEVTVLPPKSNHCEPMGFCQPVLQASFHHFLQVSMSLPGQPHPAAVVGPWRGWSCPVGHRGPKPPWDSSQLLFFPVFSLGFHF